VEATLPAGSIKSDIPLMLRQLFKDRFNLQVHEELRDVPVYALVVAKDGHKMRSCTDCPPSQSITRGEAWIRVRAVSVADLVNRLQDASDRPLVNRTGLSGNFEILVESAQIGSDAGQLEGLPSMFTEIQKLGLRLESTKALVKYLVVDGGNPVPNGN
jgi:uncharacterized protein (TIGR03435 family)